MISLGAIGEGDDSKYVDRPTVKVVVRKGNKVLILSNGLLPGGGIDNEESNTDAIHRELLEELGMAVAHLREIGEVIQYRQYLGKKYLVYGYEADFVAIKSTPTPQDKGEAQFTYLWVTPDDALTIINSAIDELKSGSVEQSDRFQGKLYNLMTARMIMAAIK